MSAAMRVMRRISSSVAIGLLANPHTPLWITRTPKPPPPRPPPPPPPPPLPPPPPAPAADARGVGVAVGPAARVHAARHAAREPDVGVRAADLLRLAERDVRQPLELRGQRIPLRRLRDQLGDQIARRNQQTSCAGIL